MVLVTIAFDSQTLVAPSLNNHIDAVPHGANLGRDVVATLQQPAKNFALEVRGDDIGNAVRRVQHLPICDPTVHRRHEVGCHRRTENSVYIMNAVEATSDASEGV